MKFRHVLVPAEFPVSLTAPGQQLHNGIALPEEWPPRHEFVKAPCDKTHPPVF